jgi:ATP-dependent RNA helicase DeaD
MQPVTPIAESFAELGLSELLLKATAKMGWEKPSEVQACVIPEALAGHDVLGQARTGTGKTGAFALPILQRLGDHDANGVCCLVLAPTRELAAQVAEEFRILAQYTKHQVAVAFGGHRLREQAQHIRKNPAVLVGTPGRVIDLLDRQILKLDHIAFAVLDEVDRMLDIGFRDDIRNILGRIKRAHQTIFVSATISGEINRLARQYMHDPVEVLLAPDKPMVEKLELRYINVQRWDKRRLLLHLLQQTQGEAQLAIVFTATRREAVRVAKYLKDKSINAKEIHGDLMQVKREKIMKQFRQSQFNVLVATDLASRGLDIDEITHIINYDVPEDPEAFVHRVGRTARMGESGWAITLITPEEGKLLTEIEKLIDKQILPMKVDGFEPSEPPAGEKPEAAAPAAPPPLGRSERPLYEGEAAGVVRRTLGSKFPPRRRRRL